MFRLKAFALPLVVLLAACALHPKPLPERENGRRTISEGYSLLHYAVSEQKWLDKVLLLKTKSKPVGRFVERVSKNARELEGKLDDIASRYPAIRVAPPPPSEVEQRARQAQYKEQVKSMLLAPQRDFERREFWTGVQHELEGEYREATDLLEQDYVHGPSGALSSRR